MIYSLLALHNPVLGIEMLNHFERIQTSSIYVGQLTCQLWYHNPLDSTVTVILCGFSDKSRLISSDFARSKRSKLLADELTLQFGKVGDIHGAGATWVHMPNKTLQSSSNKKKRSAKQSKSDLYTSLYILFGVVSFPHFPSSMQTAERWVHKLRTQRAGDESWTWGCKNPMKPLKFSIKIQIREPFNPIFKQKLRNYMKLHETT